MSKDNGPSRRRRIAGEAPANAPKAQPKRAIVPKPVGTRNPRKTPTQDKPVARDKSGTRGKPVARDRQKTKATSTIGRRPPRGTLLWLVPLVLGTLAALVFGGWFGYQGIHETRSPGIDGSNKAAVKAAGTATEKIFSFQYNKLDEHSKEAKATMTPKFSKEYDKVAPALTELAPQRKIVVKAVTRDAAPLPCGKPCSDTKAKVLVFVDQARRTGSDKTPTVFANRIEVEMTKSKGEWLVSNITAL